MSVSEYLRQQSFYEASARERLLRLLDESSFREFLGPQNRTQSPHLAQLNEPGAFDDGIVVGEGLLGGETMLVAAQEGRFLGGAVGEVHGAKLAGLLDSAVNTKPRGVLLLLESGGVRLHEANAGLIAISEVMRSLLSARAAGIPVIALIGGANGCFGGMGIVARLCDRVIMSEEGRLALSGPEVIETVRGVEEFDSRDRALVWRTTGGKHRYLLGEADDLVADSIPAFRQAALQAIGKGSQTLDLESLTRKQAELVKRNEDYRDCLDGLDIWRTQGIAEPERLPLLEAAEFVAAVEGRRCNET